MAIDAFLKISTIPGECADARYLDWIELLSFSHSMSQSTAASVISGGGRSAHRVNFESFLVTKTQDKASVKIVAALCNGRHLSEVELQVCRATGEKALFMVYFMSDVVISMYELISTPSGSESLPVERVAFSFGKIKWTYTETDHMTGQPKGDISSWWDLTSNTGG